MARNQSWETEFNSELRQAETARAAGNEGKARVCARRAAGLAIQEYLHRQGIQLDPGSAYAYLRYLAESPGISSEKRLVASHFLERVTAEHTLPGNVDLIEEARWLESKLLVEEGD
jgi:hypothetical protein